MKKRIWVLGLVVSISLAGCGNNSGGGTTNDTSASSVPVGDSGAGNAPANGMGDSTLFKDSNNAGTSGTANDSVKRIGGSSTSNGDTGKHKPGK